MATNEERRLILEMIENGKITAEDGLHLLEAIPANDRDTDETQTIWQSEPNDPPSTPKEGEEAMITLYTDLQESPLAAGIDPTDPAQNSGEANPSHTAQSESVPQDKKPSFPLDVEKWRRWWSYPMYAGVAIMVIGAGLMYWALEAQGAGFWFACSWVPFLGGVLLIFLAWQSRNARWLHLRVRSRLHKLALSFPIPIRFSAWFLRTFRDKIPGLENTAIDELVLALGNSANSENPFYVEVNEGENGEQVQVFIG